MSNRPYKCGNCGNWYIKLPMPDDVMCRMCNEGTHAPHPKTGIVDCHWGQTSPTPSEIKMVELLNLCQSAVQEEVAAVARIQRSKDMDGIRAVVSQVEQVFSRAELAHSTMPEILRWAVVLELPGMAGASQAARFKHIDAVRDLVATNRRPPEDLAMLERSERVCREIADEVPVVLSEARMALNQARKAAQEWAAPITVAPGRKVKARAVRRPRAKALVTA